MSNLLVKRVLLLNTAFAEQYWVRFHVPYPSCITCFRNIQTFEMSTFCSRFLSITISTAIGCIEIITLFEYAEGNRVRYETEVSRSTCEFRNKSSGSVRELKRLS